MAKNIPERLVGAMGGATQQAVHKVSTRAGRWLRGRIRAELCDGLVSPSDSLDATEFRAVLALRVRKVIERLDRVLGSEQWVRPEKRMRGRPTEATPEGLERFLGQVGEGEGLTRAKSAIRKFVKILLQDLRLTDPPLVQVVSQQGYRVSKRLEVAIVDLTQGFRVVPRWAYRTEPSGTGWLG